MTFTADDLPELERAIASGALRVTSNGKTVEYRSIPELLKARDIIKGDLEGSGSLPKRKRFSYVSRGNR
jgi:hypothetical protein